MPLKNQNREVGVYHQFIQQVICFMPLEVIQTIMGAQTPIFSAHGG
jgi:hypothetical protein